METKSTVDKGRLKSLGFLKPMIHAGEKHAVIIEYRILPPHLGTLEVAARVIETPPSLDNCTTTSNLNGESIFVQFVQRRNLPGLLHFSPRSLEGS